MRRVSLSLFLVLAPLLAWPGAPALAAPAPPAPPPASATVCC